MADVSVPERPTPQHYAAVAVGAQNNADRYRETGNEIEAAAWETIARLLTAASTEAQRVPANVVVLVGAAVAVVQGVSEPTLRRIRRNPETPAASRNATVEWARIAALADVIDEVYPDLFTSLGMRVR